MPTTLATADTPSAASILADISHALDDASTRLDVDFRGYTYADAIREMARLCAERANRCRWLNAENIALLEVLELNGVTATAAQTQDASGTSLAVRIPGSRGNI